jgi:transcriptional regulator with XRE-family HTH domain
MQTLKTEIGERLSQERKLLNLTQMELMDKIGSGRLSIIAYEAGRTTMRADQLAVLDQLGFDILYIFTGRRSLM